MKHPPRQTEPSKLVHVQTASHSSDIGYNTLPVIHTPIPYKRKPMRFPTAALAALALAACAASPSLPRPQTLPTLDQAGLWFKLEQTDASGNAAQTSLLAVEQLSDGIRFVQTDALGAPVSRQFVGTKGWKNDGFIMPNSASRRLFAALLPLLAADRAAELYPEVEQKTSEHNTFCPDGNGAVFRYKEQDLWCVAQDNGRFVIAFPDKTRWTVSPIKEEE